MTWEPGQYLKYAGERLRPGARSARARRARRAAHDRRSRLRRRQRHADSRRALAGRAHRRRRQFGRDARAGAGGGRDGGQHRVVRRPISPPGRATPAPSVDLVYSNAALHWLDDHATLFPRLMRRVAPRRRARRADAVEFLGAVATSPCTTWRTRRAGARGSARSLRPAPVAPAAQYFDWLVAACGQRGRVDRPSTCTCFRRRERRRASGRRVDEGDRADAVSGGARRRTRSARSSRDCAERVAPAYPALPDGRVLYPFRRAVHGRDARQSVRPPDRLRRRVTAASAPRCKIVGSPRAPQRRRVVARPLLSRTSRMNHPDSIPALAAAVAAPAVRPPRAAARLGRARSPR